MKILVVDNFVKLKSTTPTKTLYGVSGSKFFDMKYQDALELKIMLARGIIEKENDIHYLKRDSGVISKCLGAIKYNEDLLKEMGISLDYF